MSDRGGDRYAAPVSRPHRFVVTWGRVGRYDFAVEAVDAWDPEEALVIAAERHPELPRPRTAVLATQAGSMPFPLPPDL